MLCSQGGTQAGTQAGTQGVRQDNMNLSIQGLITDKSGKKSVNQMAEQLHVNAKNIRRHIDNMPFIRNVAAVTVAIGKL